jgi:outer membrane lipoprotein carrier protein
MGVAALTLGSHPAASRFAPEDPPAAVAPRFNLRDVLSGVESRYNGLKSMTARFEQILRQGTGVIRREEGELYLSKPGRMRWEYESPEPKLFVTDGKRVILYIPSENRVMESPIKETDDIRAPLAFLLGRLDFEEQFQRMETSPHFIPVDAGNFVFKAYSKQLAERVEWVLFEVTPDFEIRRVVALERGGLETEFHFNGMETNPRLADSIFRFIPPQGAEVVRE